MCVIHPCPSPSTLFTLSQHSPPDEQQLFQAVGKVAQNLLKIGEHNAKSFSEGSPFPPTSSSPFTLPRSQHPPPSSSPLSSSWELLLYEPLPLSLCEKQRRLVLHHRTVLLARTNTKESASRKIFQTVLVVLGVVTRRDLVYWWRVEERCDSHLYQDHSGLHLGHHIFYSTITSSLPHYF